MYGASIAGKLFTPVRPQDKPRKTRKGRGKEVLFREVSAFSVVKRTVARGTADYADEKDAADELKQLRLKPSRMWESMGHYVRYAVPHTPSQRPGGCVALRGLGFASIIQIFFTFSSPTLLTFFRTLVES
jgi:hypothetical protein